MGARIMVLQQRQSRVHDCDVSPLGAKQGSLNGLSGVADLAGIAVIQRGRPDADRRRNPLNFPLNGRAIFRRLCTRGILVSYETVRRWVRYFGPTVAADPRRRPSPRPIPFDLMRSFIKIDGRLSTYGALSMLKAKSWTFLCRANRISGLCGCRRRASRPPQIIPL
jgi:hypothetical protein